MGSITQISDNSGNLAAEYSYDAWGRMRNPANWQVYAQGSQPAMPHGARGYTGHEHLNSFGLINMNARLYDPLLARFLAPDPYIGSSMSNDFNRYVYCRNNPMMYTDINGKSFRSWWKKNIADPFIREWKNVFGNGFTIGIGTDTQFSTTRAVIAPNGPNGMPYGPGFGVQTNNWNTFSPVYANYQGGFFNTQPVNFESNLQKTVVRAEQSARSEYFGQKTFENSYAESLTAMPVALRTASMGDMAITVTEITAALTTFEATICTFGTLFFQSDNEDHSYLDKDANYEERGVEFKETIQPRNNENYFQNGPGYPDWMKWLMRGAGGAAAGQALYDSWPRIDTTIVHPTYNYFYNSDLNK